MYTKLPCPECGSENYHDLSFWIIQEIKAGKPSAHVDEVYAEDSVTAEQLAQSVIQELRPFMDDGMTTDEFCKLLKKYFGVASRYCCDLIQRMMIELDMYCPDHEHLYFVEA
ncbi:hypothetical protein [Methanococcoides alaskense]|uniref:Uncharacterized protein n=1 Tax=Methanococcoides alaskense TaxID=325778 RepID=A0AA90ZDG6_9EURY|nr:hypothetical protein [Methanococcoides alaskense]MDA0525606.1 hypothetical protein [Methanococcoides alaskense]MDR6223522.1 hypothetical protein [Methanococcoides alaskense]